MTYIIAELGSVHDGSLGNACRLIHECALAGVDAVKLQDHRGEKVKGDPPWFKGGEQRGDYLRRTEFTPIGWQALYQAAKGAIRKGHDGYYSKGIDLIVSPFSVYAVELQEAARTVDAYKIASGQVTNLPMLEAIGKAGRRVYLSSGMSTLDEDGAAIRAISRGRIGAPNNTVPTNELRRMGVELNITRMACTSEYPVAPERVGLNRFDGREDSVYAGFSDHTLGFAASLAAITLGASVIERHVCFDRRGYGTDCAHSLTLDELAAFVREVRSLDIMLANPVNKDELARSPEMIRMREAFLEQP